MPVTDATVRQMRRMVVELSAITDAQTKELSRAYVDAWDVVVGQLTDALTELATEPITSARVQRSARIASALQRIADQLDGLAAHTGVVISDGAGHAVSIALEAQAAIVGSQLPAAGVPLVSVNPDVVRTIVHRTATQITARSRPLAEAGQVAVRQALLRGAASADHPVKVARDMVRLARSGFVDLPMSRAEAISRTELLDAGRAAAQSWGEANADVLAGWQWLSARSLTTCPACFAMDGTVHPLSESGPDGHVRCQCTRLTLSKPWSALGIDLPEPPSTVPSARQVFDGLSRPDQLTVMGPSRLRALDDGADWSALARETPNVGWRRSFQATPVRNLQTVA